MKSMSTVAFKAEQKATNQLFKKKLKRRLARQIKDIDFHDRIRSKESLARFNRRNAQ